MISTDDLGIKRDIDFAVSEVFQTFEKEHQRLPTTEEFRQLFEERVDELVGTKEQWEQVGQDALEVLSQREQAIWATVCESEAQYRQRRSEFEDYESF
uniref:hypothetical protein n=1 Tax=Thaumasiovibrio occultus TaxID=1891184 RepID=UPI000B3600DE|nr:hypothetical protein [Thaumasiovibrio occultus]